MGPPLHSCIHALHTVPYLFACLASWIPDLANWSAISLPACPACPLIQFHSIFRLAQTASNFFHKSGFLTSNNEILISQIIDAVSKSKDSKLNELDREIELLIKNQFTSIEEDIKAKAKKVSNMLIETFISTLNAPLKTFEQKLKNDEETLQKQISSFEENDKNKGQISIDIHKNIKKLENISTTIKGLY